MVLFVSIEQVSNTLGSTHAHRHHPDQLLLLKPEKEMGIRQDASIPLYTGTKCGDTNQLVGVAATFDPPSRLPRNDTLVHLSKTE